MQGTVRLGLHAVTPVLLATMLAGCALDTRMPKPDTHLPTTFEASSAQGAGDAATLDRWWRLFNDAQLTDLIEQSLVSSPDARSAVARIKEANADFREVVFGYLPQGDIKGAATAEHVTTKYQNVNDPQLQQFLVGFSNAGNDKLYSGGLNVSWELDLFGRDFTAIRAARADYAAQRFDYEATRMSLAATVATQLFQARGLAIQLADANDNARLARQLAEVGIKKANIGIGTTADSARLEADAIALDAQAAQTDALLKGAIRSLLVLIGRGADPSASLPIEAIASPPPGVPATAPGELLARRPDVREAEARVRSAAGRLKLDKLAILPTFTLQPSYQYSQQQAQFTTITTTGAAGVGVTVPFLSIPKLLAEVRAQGARGEQAVIAYEKAVQTAYGDAEKGLTTLQADEFRVGLLKTATDKSRFAYDAARKGYDLGLTDTTSLVQAEQLWRQTRATYTAAATASLVDAVATFKALGGGWPASVPNQKFGSIKDETRDELLVRKGH
jgi:NodT family efflux transporter outer membrane factor (OMF) lipoprotein